MARDALHARQQLLGAPSEQIRRSLGCSIKAHKAAGEDLGRPGALRGQKGEELGGSGTKEIQVFKI